VINEPKVEQFLVGRNDRSAVQGRVPQQDTFLEADTHEQVDRADLNLFADVVLLRLEGAAQNFYFVRLEEL